MAKGESKKPERLTIKIDRELKQDIDRLAKDQNMTKSEAARMALVAAMRAHREGLFEFADIIVDVAALRNRMKKLISSCDSFLRTKNKI